MDTTILEDLGLTTAEIKIYLALLELGSSTAGPILKKTGLQNSVVHMTLSKLVEKGFAHYTKRGKIKHYQAADPNTILDFIEEKKKRFKEILPQLLVKQQKVEKQESEVYEGFKGFKAMFYEMIKDAKPGDEFLFFAFHTEDLDAFDQIFNFYRDFEKERKKRGIKIKGIVPRKMKEKMKGRDPELFIYVDFPIPANVSIFQNKISLTPWEAQPICFLITSRQLADSFRAYFYSIWNKYKK